MEMKKIIIPLLLGLITNTISAQFNYHHILDNYHISMVDSNGITEKIQILEKDSRWAIFKLINKHKYYHWYEPNKVLVTKGGYGGHLLHGEYQERYADKNLKVQGRIRYGLKVGRWMYWYPDGELKLEERWKRGKKRGKFIAYDNSGNTIRKGRHKGSPKKKKEKNKMDKNKKEIKNEKDPKLKKNNTRKEKSKKNDQSKEKKKNNKTQG